jgi:hypothetical protein
LTKSEEVLPEIPSDEGTTLTEIETESTEYKVLDSARDNTEPGNSQEANEVNFHLDLEY